MSTRFLYSNLIDLSATVISSSSEGSDLPDDNVQHPHRGKVWRTGVAAAAEWIKFDLGTAQNVQSFVALAHTLTASDSAIRIQANATDSWGAPSVDVAVTFNADVLYHYWTSAQSYRWWRFIFTKSAAGESRDVGRIFLGDFYEAAQDIAYGGYKVTPVDLSETSRSLGGASYSDAKDIYHDVSASFEYIPDTQMDAFRAIAAVVGTHTPLFIHVDVEDMGADWLWYVKFDGFDGRKVRHYSGGTSPLWSCKMEFTEEL